MLYRHNPELLKQGKNPLQLDMRSPQQSVEDSMYQEDPFKMLTKSKPEIAKHLLEQAQAEIDARWHMYQYLAKRDTFLVTQVAIFVTNLPFWLLKLLFSFKTS